MKGRVWCWFAAQELSRPFRAFALTMDYPGLRSFLACLGWHQEAERGLKGRGKPRAPKQGFPTTPASSSSEKFAGKLDACQSRGGGQAYTYCHDTHPSLLRHSRHGAQLRCGGTVVFCRASAGGHGSSHGVGGQGHRPRNRRRGKGRPHLCAGGAATDRPQACDQGGRRS